MTGLVEERHVGVTARLLFPLRVDPAECCEAVRGLFLGRFECELAWVQVSCVVHEEIARSLKGGRHRLSEWGSE